MGNRKMFGMKKKIHITEQEQAEYEQLKAWAKKQGVYQSAQEITQLKDDIDLPIRKCVAMTALLGLEPVYSCCGFDYQGQPFHKAHQYRQPYIRIRNNIFTTAFVLNNQLQLSQISWQIRPLGNEQVLELITSMNPHWSNDVCIHTSEECVIGIAKLEKILNNLSHQFKDAVTVVDTNALTRNQLKFWQYPPKEPWVIRKEELPFL